MRSASTCARAPGSPEGSILQAMTEALPRPRPTFVLASALPPEEVRRAVATFLKANERIKGMALLERIEMSFVRKEQHLWSPQLIVDVEKGDQGSTLRARFGPHPHVWTMYMAIYFVLGILALLAISYGYSQDRVGESPTALYALPVLALLAALTYGVPFIGQGLGFDQMYQLRNKLCELAAAHELDEPSPVRAPAKGTPDDAQG